MSYEAAKHKGGHHPNYQLGPLHFMHNTGSGNDEVLFEHERALMRLTVAMLLCRSRVGGSEVCWSTLASEEHHIFRPGGYCTCTRMSSGREKA